MAVPASLFSWFSGITDTSFGKPSSSAPASSNAVWSAAEFEADEVTIITVVSACVLCGTIDLTKRLHHRVERDGVISRNARFATAFVDMYAKHGCIQTATLNVFCGVGKKLKTVELFSTMINGLAHHSFVAVAWCHKGRYSIQWCTNMVSIKILSIMYAWMIFLQEMYDLMMLTYLSIICLKQIM